MKLKREIGDIAKIIESFMNNRQRVIYSGELSEDYEESKIRARVKYDHLLGSLNELQKKELNELLDEKLFMEISSNNVFYKRGFADAIKAVLHILID